MACSSRISQILCRSITTGDFYTGLKYLKISSPPTDHASPATTPSLAAVAPTGCRTIGRQAVKVVAIAGGQRAIRNTQTVSTAKTISPTHRNDINTGYSGGALAAPAGNHPGSTQKRAASFCVRNGRTPVLCGGRTGTGARTAAGTGGGAPPDGDGKLGAGNPPMGAGGQQQPPSGDGSGSSGAPGAPTGAPISPMVRPPIQVPGVAGAYASALFSAASKQGKLDIVEQDLLKVLDTYRKDITLQQFLLGPDISMPLKMEGIQAFKTLGISDLTLNLLATLVQNRRMPKLLHVIAAYREIMSAHRGIVECEIITARPLKPEQKTKLLSILAKFLPGKTAHTVERIDTALIGGFIVTVGAQHVDMSLRRMFNTYEALIKQPA